MTTRSHLTRTEYMRRWTKRFRHNRRNEAIKELGGKCVQCGATHHLEFDHINPDEKIERIAKLMTASDEKFWTEVHKCQLLCHWCHKAKHGGEYYVSQIRINHELSELALDPVS